MARTYQITQITPSAVGAPGRIKLSSAAGNVTSSFQGKFYRNSSGSTSPAYTTPAPAGYTLIQATTFEITGNSSYAGKYTVYTPTSASDATPSSVYSSLTTEICVNEVIGAPLTAGDATTGTVQNISTFVISVAGEANLVIPPTVTISTRPIELVGRNGTPWGELYTQNFVDLVQNFAGATAPTNPFLGQTWYDTSVSTMKIFSGSSWVSIGSGGGSTALSTLTDVNVVGVLKGQGLTWDSGTSRWVPESPVYKAAPLTTMTLASNVTAVDFGSAKHHNYHYRTTAATTVTVTVKADSVFSAGTDEYWANSGDPTVPKAMPIGGSAIFGKHGAGDITFAADAGVTINFASSLTLSTLNGKVTLIKVAANTWDLAP